MQEKSDQHTIHSLSIIFLKIFLVSFVVCFSLVATVWWNKDEYICS